MREFAPRPERVSARAIYLDDPMKGDDCGVRTAVAPGGQALAAPSRPVTPLLAASRLREAFPEARWGPSPRPTQQRHRHRRCGFLRPRSCPHRLTRQSIPSDPTPPRGHGDCPSCERSTFFSPALRPPLPVARPSPVPVGRRGCPARPGPSSSSASPARARPDGAGDITACTSAPAPGPLRARRRDVSVALAGARPLEGEKGRA